MLPNGRRLVVDSKAPLAAYLDAHRTRGRRPSSRKLKHHAAQVRAHVEKLGQKVVLGAVRSCAEFVVAFLPGESFFSAALQHDPSLIEFGADQKVLVATPTTLIALLKAIGYGWRQEKIAQNAFEISRIGRELYERLAKLAESFAMVGTHLDRATRSYNEAAGTFEKRVLVSARRMKEKGVTVRKISLKCLCWKGRQRRLPSLRIRTALTDASNSLIPSLVPRRQAVDPASKICNLPTSRTQADGHPSNLFRVPTVFDR